MESGVTDHIVINGVPFGCEEVLGVSWKKASRGFSYYAEFDVALYGLDKRLGLAGAHADICTATRRVSVKIPKSDYDTIERFFARRRLANEDAAGTAQRQADSDQDATMIDNDSEYRPGRYVMAHDHPSVLTIESVQQTMSGPLYTCFWYVSGERHSRRWHACDLTLLCTDDGGYAIEQAYEPKSEPAYSELRDELDIANKLLTERQRVLDAIPPCSMHGACVPHALEWIERMKMLEAISGAASKSCDPTKSDDCNYARIRTGDDVHAIPFNLIRSIDIESRGVGYQARYTARLSGDIDMPYLLFLASIGAEVALHEKEHRASIRITEFDAKRWSEWSRKGRAPHE